MGLCVHSLGEIAQTGAERAYYIYLLDYGWSEGLGDAVRVALFFILKHHSDVARFSR